MFSSLGAVLTLATVAFLSGCTGLPRSGPDPSAVEANATVKAFSATGNRIGIDYALVDINQSVLARLPKPAGSDLSAGFGVSSGPPPLTLGIGDVVQVSVFEAQSGGLFIPADAGARPGNYITLPNQTIGRDGTLSVPYANKVKAAGRPVDAVQLDIAERLANRAIEPQVVISTVASRSMGASVLGDVKQARKIELSPAGERIIDVISEAGGLSVPKEEATVTLQRRGRSVTVAYRTLSERPQANIYVQPGDTIFVDRNRRTFLAFGLTGESGRFDFDDSNLSLGEALAKAGGLLDDKAEPQSVLLYRLVERDLLRNIGLDVSRFRARDVPVIFRANLRDPAAFFAVQQFPMQDKDVLYVSTADAVELVKFLSILNSVTASTRDIASSHDAWRD
ncbi:Capsule polysaccharide export outer membrane protein CtrA [Neorhizobium galegae bv. officinalis bv. officinalis str. HAMBI 1141]|uniref:Capsule polysaccharide export outer membrane protein CtrA n=1 Tax=Neorhizobium galegae bv. officinalis bv. officinalis str. HAMBI 1141 TaxID=1028801 RepID=A0A068T4T2_NEOGA|nr:Capsule polysaccharide export outer membrane protein CtrA [Neorhizobium galegae bv. officinalis bv. officinalis str. HAMBI 1141]